MMFISPQTAVESFVTEMNKTAKHFQLENTKFSNPHGLSDIKNKSTSNNIAKLCYYSLKNILFRKIVNTR